MLLRPLFVHNLRNDADGAIAHLVQLTSVELLEVVVVPAIRSFTLRDLRFNKSHTLFTAVVIYATGWWAFFLSPVSSLS